MPENKNIYKSSTPYLYYEDPLFLTYDSQYGIIVDLSRNNITELHSLFNFFKKMPDGSSMQLHALFLPEGDIFSRFASFKVSMSGRFDLYKKKNSPEYYKKYFSESGFEFMHMNFFSKILSLLLVDSFQNLHLNGKKQISYSLKKTDSQYFIKDTPITIFTTLTNPFNIVELYKYTRPVDSCQAYYTFNCIKEKNDTCRTTNTIILYSKSETALTDCSNFTIQREPYLAFYYFFSSLPLGLSSRIENQNVKRGKQIKIDRLIEHDS